MDVEHNLPLIIAAVLSLLAAVLHLGVIIAGPAGYRLAGAGQRFVRAAEKGYRFPAIVTLGIALVLASWAAYALSGAGVIGALPLLRPALCVITLVYLFRGLAGPFLLLNDGRSLRFVIISSALCTGIGLVHALGLVQVWGQIG
ncbi:hypothetical protein [Pseudomonas huaxiensis]|uniref:hypothetical protein n=1 Tax=Pseudomonas huaxiensis TaxID=2213017 RepID=UPI000DA6D9AF|nr:hypothetical protein [Pseudomonas huaxiensis]